MIKPYNYSEASKQQTRDLHSIQARSFVEKYICLVCEVRHWNEIQGRPFGLREFREMFGIGMKSRAALRAWERFRTRLRERGIPFRLMTIPDDSPKNLYRVGVVILATKPELDDIARRALTHGWNGVNREAEPGIHVEIMGNPRRGVLRY